MSRLSGNLAFLLMASMVGVLAVDSASADNIYLASSRDMLFRVSDGGGVEVFNFDRAIRGLHRDIATGEVWVLADNYWPDRAVSRLYRLSNPFSGTPSWTELAELERQYGGLTQVGETWYAVSSGDLYELDLSDPANPVETYVGSFGLEYTGGLGYDPVTEILYLVAYNTENALYTLDPKTAEVVRIGETGIECGGWGAEWSGGQLFAAAENLTSGSFEIGVIDVNTGAYSSIMALADAQWVAVALTVMAVPEPSLDIKPGSCPNPLSLRSGGKLPVALLGTDDFDVADVATDSLRLSRADGVGGSVSPLEGPPGPHSVIEDVGTPFDGELCDCHELGGDSIPDLLMKFSTPEVVDALELAGMGAGEDVELIVTGNLLDGTPFEARDCIRIRG